MLYYCQDTLHRKYREDQIVSMCTCMGIACDASHFQSSGPLSISGRVPTTCQLSRAGLGCQWCQGICAGAHFLPPVLWATSAIADPCVFFIALIFSFRAFVYGMLGFFRILMRSLMQHKDQKSVLLYLALSLRPRQHIRFVLIGLCWLYVLGESLAQMSCTFRIDMTCRDFGRARTKCLLTMQLQSGRRPYGLFSPPSSHPVRLVDGDKGSSMQMTCL